MGRAHVSSPFALTLSKGVEARNARQVSFWVYILQCRDGSYYTGHTEDLEYRVAQHQRGTPPGYTHDRRPVRLMWSESFDSRYEALASERRIKGWTRAKKEALMAGDWDRLSLLARNRQDERRPSTSSGRTDGVGAPSPSTVRPEPVEGRPSASRNP